MVPANIVVVINLILNDFVFLYFTITTTAWNLKNNTILIEFFPPALQGWIMSDPLLQGF
jgi:hypothetical protein